MCESVLLSSHGNSICGYECWLFEELLSLEAEVEVAPHGGEEFRVHARDNLLGTFGSFNSFRRHHPLDCISHRDELFHSLDIRIDNSLSTCQVFTMAWVAPPPP